MNQLGQNGFFQSTCIDFSANINFLDLPDSVMQAARSGLVAPMQAGQPPQAGLEDHVAKWEGVEADEVYCASGPSEVASTLMQVLKPQKALIPAPGLEEYLRGLSMAKCTVEYYYAQESNGFRICADAFCRQMTDDMDLVFLCNPNNPTAVLYDKSFLETVLRRCEAVHALLVLDESLLDLVEDADTYTMRSGQMSRSLFIIKDFTKVFALPGIRLSYGICADEQLIRDMRGAKANVSMVAKRAGIACTGERTFVEQTVQEMKKERTWLVEELKQLGMDKVKGEANIIFFASRPRLHVFSILHGIMLRDCSNLEGLHEGYYRVAVRSRAENEKLLGVLKEWQSQTAG